MNGVCLNTFIINKNKKVRLHSRREPCTKKGFRVSLRFTCAEFFSYMNPGSITAYFLIVFHKGLFQSLFHPYNYQFNK